MKIINKQSLKENNDKCCINTQIKEVSQASADKTLNIKFIEMNHDGYSPLHSHPQEHHLIITDGKGTVFDGEKTAVIQTGDVVYIASNELAPTKNNQ